MNNQNNVYDGLHLFENSYVERETDLQLDDDASLVEENGVLSEVRKTFGDQDGNQKRP